ncbi:MAG: DUF2961 domain-containing protein [Candidatus Omnitrophota bacterium]|jgi:hypothetical protein|nr:MAG: DUF2961 domain-containing protein [Candidatus Omnitrophota bacterium]
MRQTKASQWIVTAWVIAVLAPTVFAQSTMLDGLAERRDFQTKRVSSFDRTGGNADRLVIEPNEIAVLAEIEGAGIIKHIWFTINHSDPLYRRHLILRMYWDGESNPSVESPVGDFFGQGWGEEYNYASLPLAAAPAAGKALNCYFPMPFGKGAKITIENQSEKRCNAFYYFIDYEAHRKISADQFRFHAWWNCEITEPWKGDENEWNSLRGNADENPTDEHNYLILDAEGEGHYVGVNYYVNGPTPMWYGEGDDMWLIDGEKWPGSLHGTGTEDYFNSSWCPKEIYIHPYFGYPRVNNTIGWLGRTHCYRFHIQDPIVFKKKIRGSIEHGHANCLTLELATVAYWYQKEPHKMFSPLPDPEKRNPMPEIGAVEIHRWRDAWREKMDGGVLWGNEKE